MTNLNLPMPSQPADQKWLGQLSGAAYGWSIAETAAKRSGLTLVIARDNAQAVTLEAEIRFFAGLGLEILSFPDWETLPYDNFSPHQDIISTRLTTLNRLRHIERGVLIVPVSTLQHRLAPVSFLAGNTLLLEGGQRIDPHQLREQLAEAGYQAVENVYRHGDFAIRGSIIDLYPMGSELPYRIELFDDEIETLRTFDPDSQRSIETIDKVHLLPAREFPLTPEAVAQFKQAFRGQFDVDYRRCPLYQDISNGLLPAGIEYYLPLFFDKTATLFDFLPSDALIICEGALEPIAQQFWQDAQNRYEDRRHDIERPILAPEQLFLAGNDFMTALKPFARLTLSEGEVSGQGRENLPCTKPAELTVNGQSSDPLARLKAFLTEQRNVPVLFCAESAGRREALLELFAKASITPVQLADWQQFTEQKPPHAICVSPLPRGFSLPGHWQLISESQLFGNQVFQQRRRSRQQQDQNELVVRNLAELEIDAPVVHLEHGIGRYMGLQTIELDGQSNEFMLISYANEAKLYVPVSSLHLISRYSGTSDELAPLHRLGTEQWSKARQKAAEKIRDTAAELLDIYARRAARKGFACDKVGDDYRAFSASFPFEETPDQQLAIEAVIRDMTRSQPMDRLVCGDVGFGKTEVAMRAAFVAAQSGKQVALLVPTTLLAQQHFDNFNDRFADWPVNVELISRFKTAKQQTAVAEKLASGQVDIIVGTHKLIQGDIKFANLGLVIIDEEHRFGVQQKERLKSLRSEVDILTMTATPIPRTLNMAMSGMRDLSIIATPPAKRLSVKTFVRQSEPAIIKEAILRELLRGGQVYVLHNEVKSIEKMGQELAELVPEARIGIGHGQMRERELEQVMSDFYHKRFNVLLCTTIIETGIDVPNANTIIIERADKFGLAQLHQLRGRVGRSHHQAYAYLLTPHPKAITKDAQKRLEAIEAADDLGAGFTLATHDLEIRGAGELLGEEQSGQIQGIGFTLYMEMLEEAIESIKKGKTPNIDKPLQHGCEINLHLAALIPEDYLPDVHARLVMYKRISSARDSKALKELQIEMIDRFGLLPEQTKQLFRLTELKLHADALGIVKIDAGPMGGKIDFGPQPNIEPYNIVRLVQQQPRAFKLEGASVLRFKVPMDKADTRFDTLHALLEKLAEPA